MYPDISATTDFSVYMFEATLAGSSSYFLKIRDWHPQIMLLVYIPQFAALAHFRQLPLDGAD